MNRLFGFLAVFALLAPLALAGNSDPGRRASADLYVEDIIAAAAFERAAWKSSSLDGLVTASTSIADAALSDEQRCLAQAVYFEARSETLEGQLAVAQVVLNRVEDRRYPSSVCGVVFQNERLRNRCQFSFACDGLSDNPYNQEAWNIAQRISYIALSGRWEDITKSAMYYHASYVSPYWIKRLETTARHGSHIFYRDAAS